MNLRNITVDDLRTYVEFIEKFAGVHVRDSVTAPEIKLIGQFLATLGIVESAETYVNRYGVTLGTTIYIPRLYAPPTDPLALQLEIRWLVVAHESVHGRQFRAHTPSSRNLSHDQILGSGAIFAWDYLTNDESRALFEAEAYSEEDELGTILWGFPQDPVWLNTHLHDNYRIGQPSVDFALRYLAHRHATAVKGGYSGLTTHATLQHMQERGLYAPGY